MFSLSALAGICVAQGDLDDAAEAWREGLAVAWDAGEHWVFAESIFGLAANAALRGHPKTALRWMGTAEALCATGGITPIGAGGDLGRRAAAGAAATLGAEAASYRQAGAAAPIADIVAEALTPLPLQRADAEPTNPGGLSRREREVLRLLAHGCSDPDIAATLFISRRTVATHVAHIFAKLGVHSRAAAAALAVRAASPNHGVNVRARMKIS